MSDEVLLIDYDAASTPVDSNIVREIPSMYETVLDNLLTLPHVKANLVETQSLDKKWEFIRTYSKLIHGDSAGKRSSASISRSSINWSNNSTKLLETISKSRNPDIQWFANLKSMLSAGNEEFMTEFIKADGLAILIQSINKRLIRPSFSDFDIALLYEVLLCCKVAMNSSVGMDGLLAVDQSIETIARCIRFEHKLFSLQVLEILSVCCYYSLVATKRVYKGIKLAARSQQEGAFASYSNALIDGDVEVKAAIMKFINTILEAVEEAPTIYEQLKIDLNRQLFGERYAEAVQSVDKVLSQLSASHPDQTMVINRLSVTIYDKAGSNDDPYSMFTGTRKEGYIGVDENVSPHNSVDSRRDLTPRRRSMHSSVGSLRLSEAETDQHSAFPITFDVRVMDKTVTVSPVGGTMAGNLIVAKAPKALNSISGSKKSRWFELDGDNLTCLNQKKGDPKTSVASFLDIRAFTTNSVIANSFPFAFEIETLYRTMSFGCDTQLTRDKWVTALTTAREVSIVTNSTYKTQLDAICDLSTPEIVKFAELFKKQGALFNAILMDQQVLTSISSSDFGINTDDVYDVSFFLQHEMLAAGMTNKLLAVLQEFLLIPAGASFAWDAICSGTQKIRRIANRVMNPSSSGDEDDVPTTIEGAFEAEEDDIIQYAELLRQKRENSGSAYEEVSKLAVLAISKEQAAAELKEVIARLEQKVEKMKQENSANAMTKTNKLTAQVLQMEAELESEKLKSKSLGDRMKELEESQLSQQKAFEADAEKYEQKVSEQAAIIEQLKKQIMDSENNKVPLTSESADSAVTVSITPVAAPAPDKWEKYRKMLKMLPVNVVRHKMGSENLTSAEIDSFFASLAPVSEHPPSSTDTAAATSSPPRAEVAEKFVKYEKMKKVLPVANVRQKMVADGCSSEEIDSYLGDKASSSVSASEPAAFGQHALRKVGFAPSSSNDAEPPEGMAEKVVAVRPPVKLKGLFWTKLKASEIKGTLFHKLMDYSLPLNLLADVNDMFAARVVVLHSPVSEKGVDKSSSSSTPARLISIVDGKRVQNILIFMGKLRMGPVEIMNVVIELDPDVLNQEVTNTLLKVLPTIEETNALKNFPDPSKLDQASQFCYHLNRIPRVGNRLQCHEIAFSWHGAVSAVSNQLGILQSACDELNQAQQQMETVFAMILSLGNYLNVDSKWGNAYGFHLDTVNKLSTMKAVKSNQGSLLHVLAALIVEYIPELLPLSKSWVAIAAATEVSLQQVVADVAQLEQQVSRMNNEFVKIKDGRENPGLDGELETNRGLVTNPLQKRLDQFLRHSKPKIANIKALSKSVETNVAAMMALYGLKLTLHIEEDACKGFFIAISSFLRSLRTAVDDNVKRKKAAEREAREAALAKAKKDKADLKKISKSDSGSPLRDKAKNRPMTIKRSEAMPKENIFNNFHSNQEAATEAVVADFLNKRQSVLLRSTATSLYGSPEKRKLVSLSLSRSRDSKESFP